MAEKCSYDLILMDISMPELDGVKATRLIRNGSGPNRATPILALTAHALPEDFARFREAGMADAIVKPLKMQELKRVLARYARSAIPPAASSTAAMKDAISVLVRHKGPVWANALLSEFSADMSDLLAGATAWPSGTFSQRDLALIAHKCAGSASVLGVEDVFHLLKGMEDLLRTGGSPSQQAQALSEAWAPALHALQDRMDSVAHCHHAHGEADQTPASRWDQAGLQ
jgi:CheY-like chemotaxis protein